MPTDKEIEAAEKVRGDVHETYFVDIDWQFSRHRLVIDRNCAKGHKAAQAQLQVENEKLRNALKNIARSSSTSITYYRSTAAKALEE